MLNIPKYCTGESGAAKLCPPIVCGDDATSTTNIDKSMVEACARFVRKHNVYGHLKSLRENNQVLKLVDEKDFVHPDVTTDPTVILLVGLLLSLLLVISLMRCICAYRQKSKKRNFNPRLAALRQRCGRKQNCRIWRCPHSQCRNGCGNCLSENDPDSAPYNEEDARQRRARRYAEQHGVEPQIERIDPSSVGRELMPIPKRSSMVVEADVQSASSESVYVITETCLGSLKEMMSQLVDDSFKNVSQSLGLDDGSNGTDFE